MVLIRNLVNLFNHAKNNATSIGELGYRADHTLLITAWLFIPD